jgi:hypothetical protein
MTTDQLPCSNVDTPDLCAARPSGISLQTDVCRHNDENITRGLSDTEATVSARELMQSPGNMPERVDLVDGGTIERRAQYVTVGSDGKVLDPRFVWERPQGGDRIVIGWI